ncbi:MAG: KH domain-containing protein [Acidobacteriota bacterium]
MSSGTKVSEEHQLAQALASLAGHLVDEPQDLSVGEGVDGSGDVTFKVRMPSQDLGQLIGRQGRTARALRVFLGVRGTLDERRYDLEIRER